MTSQFKLFRTQNFLPMFLTQFLGAFNDNLFKNALVVLVTYRLAEQHNFDAQFLIVLIAGLYILPFFIFSATAGQLADKYEKSKLVRIIKFVEIVLMILTGIAFQYQHLYLLIFLLSLMGAQSTFFGPIKYSILPQHLKKEELIAGNGLIEAGTYIAILTGTLCGGLLVLHEMGLILIAIGIIGVAVAGYIASLYVPLAMPPAPELKIDWNIPRATKNIVASVVPNKEVFRSIIGIAWFWFVGAVFFAQFPTFAKDVLGGDEKVSTLLLTVFSIGIGVGSMQCNKLLCGEISGRVVPWAAAGVSAATFVLYFASIGGAPSGLIGVAEFLSVPKSWLVLGALAAIAASGGIYSVPLYAIMQHKSEESQRARVVACTNILDSFGMVLSSLFIMLFLSLQFTIPTIFLFVGIINLLCPIMYLMLR